MPARNVFKYDVGETFYHVYARGNNRGAVYLDNEDYTHFTTLFARYLSSNAAKDRNGLPYPHLFAKVELLAYCLMPNHFHLLLYQVEQRAMKAFMQSLMTSYARYFNKKYQRNGALFETRYRASMILNPGYLEHISRYIHLNPKNWKDYPYSSIHHYIGNTNQEWLMPQKILEMFDGSREYSLFVKDYEEHKKMLDELKHELANDGDD